MLAGIKQSASGICGFEYHLTMVLRPGYLGEMKTKGSPSSV